MIYQPRGFLAVHPRAIGAEVLELDDGPPKTQLFDRVAVVPIRGPLEQHATPFIDSYAAVQARVCGALQSADVAGVVMQIDSPGGLVSGLFECVRALRAEAKRKPLIAYVDGQACSAAYALASAASRIVVSTTAELGSIGIIATNVDATAADAMQGLRVDLITSGRRKADGNPHQPFSDAARVAAQRNVDLLAGMFFDLVAESRPLTAAAVKAQQAATYLGQLSIDAGLADEIGTLPATIATALQPRARAATPQERAQAQEALAREGARINSARHAAQKAEHARLMKSPAYRAKIDRAVARAIAIGERSARPAARPQNYAAIGAPFAQREDD